MDDVDQVDDGRYCRWCESFLDRRAVQGGYPSKVSLLDDVILFRVERMMDDGERVERRRNEIEGRVDNELTIGAI
jgi:hypothetical protein